MLVGGSTKARLRYPKSLRLEKHLEKLLQLRSTLQSYCRGQGNANRAERSLS